MFDIAWGEFVVIAVVALIVIGPKELPAVLRAIGQWTARIRRMAAEFQGQFQEALREAEMADLKKEVDNLGAQAKGFTSQFDDPMNFHESTKWEPKPAPEPDPKAETAPTPEVSEPVETAKLTGAASEPAESASAPAPQATVEPAVATAPAVLPEGSAPKGEGAVHP